MNAKLTGITIAMIAMVAMTGFAAAAENEHSLGYIPPPHTPGSEGILIGGTIIEEETKEKDTRISDSPSGFFSTLTTQEMANLYGQKYLDGDRSLSTMWMINRLDEKYNVRPTNYGSL